MKGDRECATGDESRMTGLDAALAVIAALVLVLGVISSIIRRSYVSEHIIALLIGLSLGPHVLDVLNVADWGEQDQILEQAARITLAVGLMGVALRLPKRDPLRRWRSLAILLGLLMPLMWLSSGLLVFLVLGLPFWTAMLVGAVVTPTDPILASSIVTGPIAERNLPERLRNTLSEESGFNDGLAYPLVFLPILLLTRPADEALVHWLSRTIVWEVGMAVVLGVVLGYGAGRLLRWAEAQRTIEQTSYLAYTVALALGVLAITSLLGSDGVLAVFVAGLAYDMVVSSSERAREERVHEAVNRFFVLPIFVLLGLALPLGEWADLGWRAPAVVAAVLLLRRLPAVLILHTRLRELRDLGDALFLGWFGPIGIAALYYANLSLGLADAEEAWIVGSLVISVSILSHGVTATPFARLYSSRWGTGR